MTGLAQIDGLPRHVRPGEDDDARVGVERDIVGRDRLARARLEHRMAALDDLERVSGIDHGPHVAAHVRDLRQPRDDVQQRERARRREQRRRVRGHAPAHVLEQLLLEATPALLGAEHLGLVVLQLRRHVALRARQRLTSDVILRHACGLRVTHLDAVAEHAVEAHPQAREGRARALALLEAGDPAPRLGRVAHDHVQRLVPRLANHTAVAQCQRRLVDQRGLEQGPQISKIREGRPRLGQQRGRQICTGGAHGIDRRQARAQRDEVARVGDAERGAAGEPLQIADSAQERAQLRAGLGRLNERADRVLPLGDRRGVAQRLQQPLAQPPRAHRRDGLVERADERVAHAAVGRAQELERLDGRLVQRETVRSGETPEAEHVAEVLALRRPHVGERGRPRLQAQREIAHAEGVQRADAEMRAELGGRAAAREDLRIAEGERGARRLQSAEQRPAAAQRVGDEDFARPSQQRRRQHAALGVGVLAGHELSGGDIQQRDAGGVALRRDGEQIVVGTAGEIGGVRERARRDHAHDVALEELLTLARGFHLLADGDLLAGLYEARDVAVRRVVRDAGHRRALPRRERDRQQAGAELGILAEELVEVAESEQQQVVRVAALEVAVLLHHRRVDARGPAHATRLRRRCHVVASSSGSTRVFATTVAKL